MEYMAIFVKNKNMITDIRMIGQQLAEPLFEQPGELVAWMGAIQAQDYNMCKWAVGMRLKSATLQTVNEALERGEIVRTHVMRPTWHLVAGEDIRWMLKLSSARIKSAIDSWVKGGGIEISEPQYTRCVDLLGKILSGNKSLTKEEITVEMSHAGVPTEDERVKRYLLRAEVLGIVCSGGDREGKPTYALLDEHVPATRELHREEALVKWAASYFRSHAPATLADFVWWSGLTMTEARKAIGLLGSELIEEQFGTQKYYIHQSYGRTCPQKNLHFLPPFDEYLISYKERTAALDLKHQPKAFNRYGIFYPVILHNGRIIGNWTKAVKKDQLRISTSFFEPELQPDKTLLDAAQSRYEHFFI